MLRLNIAELGSDFVENTAEEHHGWKYVGLVDQSDMAAPGDGLPERRADDAFSTATGDAHFVFRVGRAGGESFLAGKEQTLGALANQQQIDAAGDPVAQW